MTTPQITGNHFGVVSYDCGCVIESGYMVWCAQHAAARSMLDFLRAIVDGKTPSVTVARAILRDVEGK